MNNNNKKGSLPKLGRAEKGSKAVVLLAAVGGFWKLADWIIGYSGKKTKEACYEAELDRRKSSPWRIFQKKRIKELERKINGED